MFSKASRPVTPASSPLDAHSQFVERVHAKLDGSDRLYQLAHNDYTSNLQKLSISTLVMMEEHIKLTDFWNQEVFTIGETRLRSSMHVVRQSRMQGLPLHVADAALGILRSSHDFPEDVTEMDGSVAATITTACEFIIKLNLLERDDHPRELVAFAVAHPERVDDTIRYLDDRSSLSESGSFNMEGLTDYFNHPAQSLRDGTL